MNGTLKKLGAVGLVMVILATSGVTASSWWDMRSASVRHTEQIARLSQTVELLTSKVEALPVLAQRVEAADRQREKAEAALEEIRKSLRDIAVAQARLEALLENRE